LTTTIHQRLWNQFGKKLREVAMLPFFLSGDHLVRLHDQAVKKVAEHLNQQSYVWFVLAVARQHKGHLFPTISKCPYAFPPVSH
jgi:hypothetical protein